MLVNRKVVNRVQEMSITGSKNRRLDLVDLPDYLLDPGILYHCKIRPFSTNVQYIYITSLKWPGCLVKKSYRMNAANKFYNMSKSDPDPDKILQMTI